MSSRIQRELRHSSWILHFCRSSGQQTWIVWVVDRWPWSQLKRGSWEKKKNENVLWNYVISFFFSFVIIFITSAFKSFSVVCRFSDEQSSVTRSNLLRDSECSSLIRKTNSCYSLIFCFERLTETERSWLLRLPRTPTLPRGLCESKFVILCLVSLSFGRLK